MSSELGVMYAGMTESGSPCIGFAVYLDQQANDHSSEWVQILSEILERKLVPLLLRETSQHEFIQTASKADAMFSHQ